MYDLIIRNGILVTSDHTYKNDIFIKDGKIEKIDNYKNENAENVFNAEGLHILPGVIDAHVHFRDPGLTEKEDFYTGSIAAAKGGITFIADMPNVLPPTSTSLLFKQKMEIARRKSCIGFGLFALLNNENTDEIAKLAEAGALGFKVFLGTSTGNLAAPCDKILIKQLRLCTELGKRTGFHAETSEINERCTAELKLKTNMPNGIQLSEARPIESEVLAIKKALNFSKITNAMIHIHHVTCKEGLELIAQAKNEGINVTAETCPHYLFLNAEKNTFKVYPPIRTEEHRLALWDGVKTGIIDIIATDHAPHTELEKSLPLWEAPAGLTGAETFVNLMLNEVNKGMITINDFVRLACEKPALVWGIETKGKIEIGYDADFTAADMNAKKVIKACELNSKSKTTPYNGWEVKGMPAATIVGGKIIV